MPKIWRDNARFNTSTLFGFFIKSVTNQHGRTPVKGDDEIIFEGDCGRKWKLHHEYDCCESVSIEDIVGEISDLVGAMIFHAEEVSNDMICKPAPSEFPESETWTYYKLRTNKGWVEFRWYGSSNGYYSEIVDFAVREQVVIDHVDIPENYIEYEWINK